MNRMREAGLLGAAASRFVMDSLGVGGPLADRIPSTNAKPRTPIHEPGPRSSSPNSAARNKIAQRATGRLQAIDEVHKNAMLHRKNDAEQQRR